MIYDEDCKLIYTDKMDTELSFIPGVICAFWYTLYVYEYKDLNLQNSFRARCQSKMDFTHRSRR